MTLARTTPSTDVVRLLGGFLIVAVIVVALGASSAWQLGNLNAEVDNLGRDHLPTIALVNGIADTIAAYRRTQIEHVIETDTRKLPGLEALLATEAAAAGAKLAEYERHAMGAEGGRAGELRQLWARYVDESAPFIETSRRLDKVAAIGVLNGAALSTFEVMRSLIGEILEDEQAAAAGAVSRADASFGLARIQAIALTAAGVLIVLVLGIAVSVLAARSARRTAASVERLAVGEREAAMLNQFTELAALTDDDAAATAATLATLDELVSADDSMLHISNRSQDRAVPEASLGEHPAEVMSLHELGRCPALRRSALYITHDVTARLAFRCPVYPVESGTVACVPLIALGEPVGVAHLHWSAPRELPLSSRTAITRVTEHAALSIANRRLLLALRSQAGTDARTGLANSRTFDEVLERTLADRRGSDQLAVLMLDLDHFKDFNDAHGHPAGDEALRVFGEVLRSCVRDGDLAARYGGEEFAVLLPDLSADAALQIAERIRERTESSSVALAPGKTGRLTVSIGIATAPEDATQRVSLLRLADEALYRAKTTGRNRVVTSRAAPSLAVVPVGKAAAP